MSNRYARSDDQFRYERMATRPPLTSGEAVNAREAQWIEANDDQGYDTWAVLPADNRKVMFPEELFDIPCARIKFSHAADCELIDWNGESWELAYTTRVHSEMARSLNTGGRIVKAPKGWTITRALWCKRRVS